MTTESRNATPTVPEAQAAIATYQLTFDAILREQGISPKRVAQERRNGRVPVLIVGDYNPLDNDSLLSPRLQNIVSAQNGIRHSPPEISFTRDAVEVVEYWEGRHDTRFELNDWGRRYPFVVVDLADALRRATTDEFPGSRVTFALLNPLNPIK